MKRTPLKRKTGLKPSKLGLKRNRINPVSDKQKEILAKEAETKANLFAECEGHCMICGVFAQLEKNHTRDRKYFVMSCRGCHFPNGQHRYLDDVVELQPSGVSK